MTDIDMGITSSLSYSGRASGGSARTQETRNQGVPVSHHEIHVLGANQIKSLNLYHIPIWVVL
jgi:hypothetical protein